MDHHPTLTIKPIPYTLHTLILTQDTSAPTTPQILE